MKQPTIYLKAILIILLFIPYNALLSQQIAQKTPHNFTFGMFGVTDEPNFVPGTNEFRDSLKSLYSGTSTSSYEAINLLQTYRYVDIGSSTWRAYWQNFLQDAYDARLKVLIDVRFTFADGYHLSGEPRDTLITAPEVLSYKDVIQWVVDNTNTDAIGGWYISDEPENKHIIPTDLKKLYDAIKEVVPSGINNTVYVSQGADFENSSLIPPGDKDYSTYMDSWDVLIAGWYGYSTNFENTNIDNPNNIWRQNSNDPNGPEGTLRGWNYIQQKLKNDIGFPDNLPTGKKVLANLVLGEEVPENISGSRNYDTYQGNLIATHGLTHAAIKKVFDMGFDGLFFYDYSTTNIINETKEDAIHHWKKNERYEEPIQTEIHDRDWLVTAMSSSNGGDNRTYLSVRGAGQSPAAGYNEYFGGTVINNLSAGDLWGESNSDLTYVINNNQDRKSIADGDDELVYTTSSQRLWISEENHINSLFGNTLNSNQSTSSNTKITAMTTGDFDGDGDAEVVTAFTISYIYQDPFGPGTWTTHFTEIYISNEGNNFKQKRLYQRQSDNQDLLKVTALIAGDFDGIGRDKLIVATRNENYSDSYMYLSDIAIGENPIHSSNVLYSNTNSPVFVNDLAVGDFDGDFKEELATAFINESGSYSMLSISKPKIGGGAGNPGHGSNNVWYSPVSYETVTAIAAGDFKNERKDYLITAFWNSSTNTTNIYQSRPTFDSNGYGNGDPTNTSDPETDNIYYGTYYHATAMTAGSFRESLPSGSSSKIVSDFDNKTLETPSEFSLSQNYPNPFNPTTEINYSIPSKTPVQINVYDIQGRLVSELVKDVKSPGTYSVTFNASGLSSGVYIYTIITDNFRQSKKLTLIK